LNGTFRVPQLRSEERLPNLIAMNLPQKEKREKEKEV